MIIYIGKIKQASVYGFKDIILYDKAHFLVID